MEKDRLKLEEMALPDVLHLQVVRSGRSWDEVGTLCGWSPALLGRIRNPHDNYWPSLPHLAAFCRATRSNLVLEWVESQALAGALKYQHKPTDVPGLLRAVVAMTKELGDVAQGAQAVVTDGRIDSAEARRLLRELRELMSVCMDLTNGLRALDVEEVE